MNLFILIKLEKLQIFLVLAKCEAAVMSLSISKLEGKASI